MKEPKPIDIYNYESVGNLAVDMCVACIQHEMKFNKPIKAVILNKAKYEVFQRWVAKEWGEEHLYKQFFIEGVEIRKETIIFGSELMIEYYKQSELV